ncbi:EamA/RhaT family transporter, partial [Rhizobium ruizarguesonis]
PSVASATARSRARCGRSRSSRMEIATEGVLSIAFAPNAAGGSLAGNALIFCAVVCEGLFILLNKRLNTVIAPLAQSKLMAGIG